MTTALPIDRLTNVLRRVPVRLAVLFGSAARGTGRPDSDVDIAILPRDAAVSLADEARWQGELEDACGRRVDLVRLDQASSFLLGEIARDAVCLYEAEPGAFTRFRAAAWSEWLEFAPAFERAAARFRQRLVELAERPK